MYTLALHLKEIPSDASCNLKNTIIHGPKLSKILESPIYGFIRADKKHAAFAKKSILKFPFRFEST